MRFELSIFQRFEGFYNIFTTNALSFRKKSMFLPPKVSFYEIFYVLIKKNEKYAIAYCFSV